MSDALPAEVAAGVSGTPGVVRLHPPRRTARLTGDAAEVQVDVTVTGDAPAPETAGAVADAVRRVLGRAEAPRRITVRIASVET